MLLLRFVLFFCIFLILGNGITAVKLLYKDKNGVYKFRRVKNPDEYVNDDILSLLQHQGPLEEDFDVIRTIESAAKRYHVDPFLVKAIIKAESGFRNNAVSQAGAEGIMQMMPGTAIQYGVLNTFDYKENIFGGTRYLRYLLNLFMGNIQLALAAYNAGEQAVFKYGTIPPFSETQKYVKKVITFYNHYRVSAHRDKQRYSSKRKQYRIVKYGKRKIRKKTKK